MITAQLDLPLYLPEVIAPTLSDKRLRLSLNMNASAFHQANSLSHFSVAPFKVSELRTADQDDDIIRMAKEFANDVDLDEYIHVPTIKESMIMCRADMKRDGVNCFISYKGEEAVGFLVGVCSKAFHRPGVVAEQKLWYVTPPYRGSRAALSLMQAYENWALLNGATQIFTGTANRRYSEPTSRLLEKLGYARVGNVHVKEIY